MSKPTEECSRQLRYQRRQTARGLCAHCGGPAVPGRTMCEKGLKIRRDYQRVYRAELRLDTERRERLRKYQRRYRLEHREKFAEYQKTHREKVRGAMS